MRIHRAANRRSMSDTAELKSPVDRISSHEDGHLSEEHGDSRIDDEEDE